MYCLPSLLVYFCRAIVSLMCGLFLVFCKSQATRRAKPYEAIHNSMAVISIVDFSIFVWACYMLTHNIHIFNYHWIWFPTYYVEWCLLGYAVLSLVGGKVKYWWCPPCTIKYIIQNGWKSQRVIDNNLSGQGALGWSDLCKHAWKLYAAFIISTTADLLVFNNHFLDNVFNVCCMLVAATSTILVLRLQPYSQDDIKVGAMPEPLEPLPPQEHATLEALVTQWEQSPQRPYIREGLTLRSVSDEIGVSPKLLSAYLNDVRELNFNAWINSLRVEVVRATLERKPDTDIYDIMVASGFQSRSSLLRTVKQISGKTISELRDCYK